MKSPTIKKLWGTADAARTESLREARECAALSIPWLLTPFAHNQNMPLPGTYQSAGSLGVANMSAVLLLATFPLAPWFQQQVAGHLWFNPNIPDETKQTAASFLMLEDMYVQASLESLDLNDLDNKRVAGFRSQKIQAFQQLVGTGDSLELLMDDLRLKVFRRDQYVTERDDCGDVIHHITREKVNPIGVPLKGLRRSKGGAGFEDADELLDYLKLKPDEFRERDLTDQYEEMHTRCRWQPESKKWLIEQEINETIFNVSEDKVTPYISTPYHLAPGEDYGRGLIHLHKGDINSLNELNRRLLDMAGIMAKMVPVIDENSNVRENDLEYPSGVPIRARVQAGQVQDVALLQAQKTAEFGAVFQFAEALRSKLTAAMLVESQAQPRGERVTATQIRSVASELNNITQGVYIPLADQQQAPIVRRAKWVLQKKNLLPDLPKGVTETVLLTGIAALKREQELLKLQTIADFFSRFGEEATRRLNIGVIGNVILRYVGFYEPGAIKTDEQVQQEMEQEARLRLAEAATQEAINVTGDAARSQMNGR